MGRLTEALAPMGAALPRFVAAEDWNNASQQAGNLSEVRLAVGQVGPAVASGADAVRFADAMADSHPNAAFQRLAMRTKHAAALFRAADLDAAAALFADAERRQVASRSHKPLLYSLGGYLYCDLLLARGEAADVRRRAASTISIAERNNWLLDIGLDTLSLGRAALALGDTAEAAAKLDAAVTALEDSGSTDEIPRALLARAALHRTTGAWDLAAADLNATDEIADRSGMKLFQVDSALERARLTLARDRAAGSATARALVTQAKAIIETTRGVDHEGIMRWYAQPTPDIALIEARIAILAGDAAAARPHLAIAKDWIDKGWRVHVKEYEELSGERLSPPAKKTLWQRFFG
jgi:hypothetical protein